MKDCKKRFVESEFSALRFCDEDGKEWGGSIQVRAVGTKTKWIGCTKEQAEKIKQILLDG